MARCWLTGVELAFSQAWVLDKTRALEQRQVMAQRLALLDRLLEDLGPRAGMVDRAKELRQPPHSHRTVSSIIAESYSRSLEIPDLFCTLPESIARGRQHWIENAVKDQTLASKIATLSPGERLWVCRVASKIREGMDEHIRRQMVDQRADAYLALIYPGHDLRGVEPWLAGASPTDLLDRAGVPEQVRMVALVTCRMRCALARRRLQGKDDVTVASGDDIVQEEVDPCTA